MIIAPVTDDIVGEINASEFVFPNQTVTRELLAANGYVQVLSWPPHNPHAQGLVSCEPYLDGPIAFDVMPQDMSPDEISAANEIQRAKVRDWAIKLLAATDWVENPSVTDPDQPVGLMNKPLFDNYRTQLRMLAISTPSHIEEWPVRPVEAWGRLPPGRPMNPGYRGRP